MNAKLYRRALAALLALLFLFGATIIVQNMRSPAMSLSLYPLKKTMTTLFWVGEDANAENGGIANDESFWDDAWQEHFGGIDDPRERCGYLPCLFQPKENPFYVALPYGEYEGGVLKENARLIPWYENSASSDTSLLKNHWVEVRHGKHICYGQWEDVGPSESDDFAFVFGSAREPKNTFGVQAGLDVSPALWTCLGMTDNAVTAWRFMAEKDVPEGPWKESVTIRGISWE
jgi:hypothetical protein